MAAMVSSIWNVVTSIVTGFIGVLSSIFNGLIELFWTPGVGEASGDFTFLGILILIGASTPLVFYGLNTLIGWFKKMLKR